MTAPLPRSQPDIASAERCAACGFERKEHGYNGACYGVCGEFINKTEQPMDTRPKETMDFFMGPDDDAGIQFEDFITALATWGWMRPGGQPTVREAADQFGVVDQVVINAVKQHPWMFLAGDDDDDPTELKIEYDGE